MTAGGLVFYGSLNGDYRTTYVFASRADDNLLIKDLDDPRLKELIDVATWKLIKKIRFDVTVVRPQLLQPVGMEFTKDGKYLFVALGPANRVAVIAPRDYEVKVYILVGQRPWHLELSPDQTKLLSPTVSPTT